MTKYIFKTIVSNDGLFFKYPQGFYRNFLPKINGKSPKETFHRDWYFIEGESSIKSFTRPGGTKKVNERYEIIDAETFPNLKKVFTLDEIQRQEYNEDGEYEISYKNLEFQKISQLYKLVSDTENLPDIYEEFEEEVVASIEKIDDKIPFEYRASADRSYDSPKIISEVSYDLVTQMTVPEIMRHNYPCYISSKTSYDIIRQHIKDNINSAYSEVTSDYGFCFNVAKKYILHKPIVLKREKLTKAGKSFSTPRFSYDTKTYEKKEIFKMTNSEDKYKGYTVIEGFKGSNLIELKEHIDSYLTELMEVINSPVKYCECCGGTGISSLSDRP